MKNKRKVAWGTTVVLAIFGIAGIGWFIFGKLTITMSQQELQDKINAKMPHTTANGITVSGVNLDLSDNKIGIAFEAKATKLKTDFALKADTKGSLRYDNTSGKFYFAPEQVHLRDVKVNSASVPDTVGKLVNKITPQRLEEEKAKLAKKGAELLNGAIQSAAETTLEHMSVYKIKDDFKGSIAKLVLEKVEVKDGNVIAHLSFWQLTKTVIGFMLTLALAIMFAIALAANPDWGRVVSPF